MRKWNIYSINKLCIKTDWKYQIINPWLHLQYTKSKLISSEIFYGYGRSGWSKPLVWFHEQGYAYRSWFSFGLTFLIGGGWSSAGIGCRPVVQDIPYVLFLASRVGIDWRRPGQSIPARPYRHRDRRELPKGLRPTRLFTNGNSRQLWMQQQQQQRQWQKRRQIWRRRHIYQRGWKTKHTTK